ncbi:MAG: flippase-like domain-containing protein [Clostridia bacterium]|nr:flippase-like domain-containing protein [Clostridia bacterium]
MEDKEKIEKTEYNDVIDGAAPETGNTETVEAETPSENTEAEVPAPPKKKRLKQILWNLFLVAVIAVGIVSLFGVVKEIDHDAGATFGDVIRGASPLFLVVLLVVVLVQMSLDVAKFSIISKTVTGKFRILTSAKTNFIGKYYDAVTPFSTGGQPMQIYYLSTKGISGGNSSAIVLIRYIFSILCWIALGAALMIAGAVKGVLDDVSGGNLLKITGWIGIAVNLIVPAFVLFFLVLPKFMHKLTVGVIKLGAKLKIVKNMDKATERALKTVNDFKNSFKLMATSPVKFIILILVCFSESALTFSIPYFIMKAFSCPVDGLALAVMSLNVFAIFGVSFIPTPGNSGVMEGMGALAFSVAAGASLIWSVITWRLLTFYIYIIVGLIITVCDMIKKNIRSRKGTLKSE